MSRVSMAIALNAPAKAVWELIGGFDSTPDWHPSVRKSTLLEGGRVRRLDIEGGGTIFERLLRFDEKTRTCTYAIIGDSPLPVADYRATLRVTGKGRTCTVRWSSQFKPKGRAAESAAAIRGVYREGFDSLRKKFRS